jgi:hypothetical protein
VYPPPPATSFTVPPQVPAYRPGTVEQPAGRVFGAPRIPRSLVRARLLLLVLSVLTALSVVLVFYASAIEEPSDPADQTSFAVTVAAEAVAILIVATPLSLVPMVLSILIGRGRNWARITSIVVLLTQAVFCTCFGSIIPFLPATTGPGGSGEKAVLGDSILGVLGVLIGAASVVVSILLLTKDSRGYFQAMAQWRKVAPARRP